MENVKNVFYVIYQEILIMGPYFLISVLIGALMKTYKIDRWLYSFLNRSKVISILIATVAGVVSPMCSCGILPVFVTLLDMGAPLSASVSLLITSPVMSIEAFILTYGVLGYKMAYIKLFGAVFIGLSAGFVFLYLEKIQYFSVNVLKRNIYEGKKGVCQIRSKEHGAGGIGQRLPVDTQLADNKLLFFYKRARELFIFIGKFSIIAILIDAIISVYVPFEWVEAVLGEKGGVRSIINAVLIGIPLPVNGISVVNVLKGLMEKGMSNGAAVAFLFAGPVTAIPAIIALAGMVEKRVVFVFLTIGILSSFLLGLVGQFIF
ncbi:MAG: permease [bacterium]|nr:permease [bacterium]